MKCHPNIAFFGGTVIIAIMDMAAFANVANACHHNAETKDEHVKPNIRWSGPTRQ